MAQIWPLPMHTTEKIILLKLADCASDDGRNAYPTVARIAAETGVCERTVQYTLRRLEEHGYLSIQQESGRHRATSYQLNMGALDAPLRARMGATDDVMGATDDVHGCKAFAPDPSLTVIDPSEGRVTAPRAQLFPPDVDAPNIRNGKRKREAKIRPLTEAEMAGLVAEYPDFDVPAELANCRNLRYWETKYASEHGALRNRLRLKRADRDSRAMLRAAPAPGTSFSVDDPDFGGFERPAQRGLSMEDAS